LKSYSHSALSSYETCPLQYKFRYIDRIKRIAPSVEAFLGIRVHDVLERLYRDVLMQRVPALEELLSFYDEQWGRHWQDGIQIVRDDYGKADYKRLGSRCIEDYYRRYYPFDDSKTLALEKKVSISISSGNGYRIVGYIDRLAQTAGGVYEIHDYKTSSSLPDQAKLDEDRQLGLYQIAVQECYRDAKEVRLVWHYLVFDKTMESRRTKEDMERLKEQTAGLIREIEGRKEFPPKEGPLCPWCDYQDRCPLRSHLFKVSELTPEEYAQESGVRLVEDYVRLLQEKRGIEDKLDRLKEVIVRYCDQNSVMNLAGSAHRLSVREFERSAFPSRSKDQEVYFELYRVLKEGGRLEEVSKLSDSLLNSALETGGWDEELVARVRKFQRTVKSVMIKVAALERNEKNR
jgi:putative RecB family exonuclease